MGTRGNDVIVVVDDVVVSDFPSLGHRFTGVTGRSDKQTVFCASTIALDSNRYTH